MDIGGARFFFTPGVPRELRRMLEEQIIPRLLARSGSPTSIKLKRYHTYGLGESNVDQLLTGVEALVPDGSVKLGFRAHYPQIETKLTIRGTDAEDIGRKLMPVDAEIRERLGNFIIAEDDETLESVVLAKLAEHGDSLALVETYTSGEIAARMAHLPGAERVFRCGIVARDFSQLNAPLGLRDVSLAGGVDELKAEAVARAALRQTEATHALAVLIELDEGADRMDLGGTIWIAIATANDVAIRRSRILGGREWIRLGAVELGLDCLRRYLNGLPVHERSVFERS
jgi:nicotinamide-nucleotide amidase